LKAAADRILDLRGMIIPVTFLKVTRALREMKAGETIEIVGNDPETRRDLFKILQTFSYELLTMNNKQIPYRIRLIKGRPNDAIVKSSRTRETHDPRPR